MRSEREAVVAFFQASGLTFARIGLEAGPLSQWLHAGLVEAGLPATCIETRHVKAALKAMTVKTDKNDARGMAQLMRLGWFRILRAALLAPDIVDAILAGRTDHPMMRERLERPLPASWAQQGAKLAVNVESPKATRALRASH